MVKQYNIIPHGNITNNNGILSGFTTNTYASLNKIFNPVNNPYELVFKFNSNNIADEQIIFQCGDVMSSSGLIDLEIYESKFYFELDKNGGQTFYFVGSTTLVSQTDYWAKLTYDGTNYYELSLSTDGVNYTVENSTTNSNILGDDANNQSYIGIDIELTRWYFNGTIDLNESYIKINDNIFWQGVSDVTRIQLRHDTSDNWSAINPILLEGEVGLELDIGKQKVGDGVTAWNNLDYNYYTETETDDLLADKQNILVSGTNIKTINNTSLLGSGNIDTSEVFIAEYGVTSFADIETAYNAGKAVFCKAVYELYVLVNYNPTAIRFSSINGNETISIRLLKNPASGSGWTLTNSTLQYSNLVTSLSSSSTNTQYPSAKCVYDLTENNRFDGQWVGKYSQLSTAKATGTYNLDLSTYLPDDTYNYEVYLYAHVHSGNSTYTNIYARSSIFNSTFGSDSGIEIACVGTNGRQGLINTIIPIGTDRILTLIIENRTLDNNYTGFCLAGYRRIGTNS